MMTEWNKSGRMFTVAPIVRPPADLPSMANLQSGVIDSAGSAVTTAQGTLQQ